MTSILAPSSQPIGVSPSTYPSRLINKTGADVLMGEVVQLDFKLSVATTFTPGTENSAYSVAIDPYANNSGVAGAGWYAVALENVANNMWGSFAFRGHVRLYCYKLTVGSVSKGVDILHAVAGENRLDGATQNFGRCLALSFENTTASAVSSATSELVWCLFNGIEGLGHK